MHVCSTAHWGHSLRLRNIGFSLDHLQNGYAVHQLPESPQGNTCRRYFDDGLRCRLDFVSLSLDPQHASQVSRFRLRFGMASEGKSVFERHHRFVGWYVLFRKWRGDDPCPLKAWYSVQ